VIIRVELTRVNKDGLRASFEFKLQPRTGASIRTSWYYNNKLIGTAKKTRAATISTGVHASAALPAGYWRCTLEVKLGPGRWRAVKDARLLLKG
jgi:hypothetical protein